MKPLLASSFVVLATCSTAFAQATLTWDADTTTTGAQDGAGSWDTGNSNWWNGTANTSFAANDNVIFGAASGAAGSISVDAGGVTAGSLTFNQTGSGSYAFSGGSITGGILTKNGTMGLRLDNSNSFTSVLINSGPNSQSDGAIRLGNANALGTAPITFANTGSITGLYFLAGFGNATTFSNNIAFSTSSTAGLQTRLLLASNTSGGPQVVTFSGLLTGGVSASKIRIDGTTASGQSVLRLTNASNSVALSEWEIWRGALEITSDGSLGDANNALRLNVGASGDPVGTGLRFGADNITLAATRNIFIADRTNIHTFGYAGSQIDGAVAFSNTVVKKGSSTLTLNGSATGTGGIRIDEGLVRIGTGGTTGAVGTGGIALQSATTGLIIDRSNAISLSNAISGTGSLTKNGAGTATLSGTNTYSGGTTINGGRIAIAAANQIGTGDINFTAVGTGLEITGTAVTLANNITLPTSGTGNVTLLTPASSSTVINGDISGGGAGTVLFFQGGASGQNTGALTLNGNNTLEGTINVQRGPLILGNTNAAGSARIVLDSNSPPEGALQLGNFTIANSVQLTGGASLGVATGNNAGISGIISGGATLTKLGNGTLTLAGDNTYTGATNVNAGTLLVEGSNSSTALTTVANGATIGGSGSLAGDLSVSSGGTLAPGSSAGTFSTGNLSLASGSTVDFEFGLLASDLVNVTGSLSLAGASLGLSNLDTGTLSLGHSLTLFGYTGLLTGTFTGLADLDQFNQAGYNWQIRYADVTPGTLNGGTGSSFVTLTVVPEPSAALLGGLGLLVLLRRRR
jgi:autotransporter-associated beta strand protein